MRARVVVFPIKGRNWCFSRCLDPTAAHVPSSKPQKLRDLFRNITSTRRSVPETAEMVEDFTSEKMNRAWVTLEKAPEGTFKSKLHSLGLWLLSRVKPSEMFLKSVSKDLTGVEVTYPASLNPRLVRRRLRHIAMRGSAIHRKHLYGSVTLLPLTSVLTVLPLPNVPFFWILFRAYSHWKALKGSERLLLLVSDCSRTWSSIANNEKGSGSKDENDHGAKAAPQSPLVLKPSEDLDKLIVEWTSNDGIRSCTINAISELYSLDKKQVLKYKDSL
ncbi:uncharacterized protein LOC110025401 [Phalaenopsis equestris]|uniref:uncharacterized protein LOC110025401 n=1 Tax=Phalaenopsis equestris TaxID=78828 RepID=UPI0009E4A463|nr:uncharacterized protein LOC110025401 [Phalaenopsis equestris]